MHLVLSYMVVYVFLDIVECDTGAHSCHANAACTNTPGAYTCACMNGFTGDGQTCTGETNKIIHQALTQV